MFALEIIFPDPQLPAETVLIRRPLALVGGVEYAHVVIDDMSSLDFQLKVVRGIGRTFSISAVGSGAMDANSKYSGTYYGNATIELGVVTLYFTSLDLDCALRDGEVPDKAGIRVLQTACRKPSPRFPALVVKGIQPIVLSYSPDMIIQAGRAKDSFLRFDSVDVSNQHARFGTDDQVSGFWVEDLGSTNGTFYNGVKVNSRVGFKVGEVVTLGREISVTAVVSDQQLDWVVSQVDITDTVSQVVEPSRYPVLVSLSEVARPTRLLIPGRNFVNIGRDPTSDMWIGAPHVSRRHAAVRVNESGGVEIADHSTNAVMVSGETIGKGRVLEVNPGEPAVLDFGVGVTVAICFDEFQERRFVDTGGSVSTFIENVGDENNLVTDSKIKIQNGVQLRSVTQVGLPSGDEDVPSGTKAQSNLSSKVNRKKFKDSQKDHGSDFGSASNRLRSGSGFSGLENSDDYSSGGRYLRGVLFLVVSVSIVAILAVIFELVRGLL